MEVIIDPPLFRAMKLHNGRAVNPIQLAFDPPLLRAICLDEGGTVVSVALAFDQPLLRSFKPENITMSFIHILLPSTHHSLFPSSQMMAGPSTR
jgi:hypothetical protein